MSSFERVQDLKLRHKIMLSHSYLKKLYKKNNIKFRLVDLHMTNKIKKAKEL